MPTLDPAPTPRTPRRARPDRIVAIGAGAGAGIILASLLVPSLTPNPAGQGAGSPAGSQPGAHAPRAESGAIGVAPAPVEARGVWVATVDNIDWPSRKDLHQDQQRAEIIRICELAAGLGLNFIVLQVRPSCDAIYPSSLEPWSEFLTGEQGRPPLDPTSGAAYDPLAMWVAETHRRGLELHAWINPFRARHAKATGPDAPTHLARARPEWVRRYADQLWLDPGDANVHEHVLSVVEDILTRYDVDGVHIDDYFYPYPKDNVPFDDDATYGAYRASTPKDAVLDRPAWRRRNVDTFVRRLYERVKLVRPSARVGISPFGVWRPNHPPGVQAMDALEKLHADSREWLRQGWLDYLAPQLYWPVDAPKQPFRPLLAWWQGENILGREIWPGLIPSRIADPSDAKPSAPPSPWSADEIARQVHITRELGAGGTILFSMRPLLQDRAGVATRLREGPFAAGALLPPKGGTVGPAPAPPTVRIETLRDGRGRVLWSPAATTSDVRCWVVATRRDGRWSHAVARPGDSSRVLPAEWPDAVAVFAVDGAMRPGAPGVELVSSPGAPVP